MNSRKKGKSIVNELIDDLQDEELTEGELDLTNDVNHSNEQGVSESQGLDYAEALIIDVEEDSFANDEVYELTNVQAQNQKTKQPVSPREESPQESGTSSFTKGNIQDLLSESIVINSASDSSSDPAIEIDGFGEDFSESQTGLKPIPIENDSNEEPLVLSIEQEPPTASEPVVENEAVHVIDADTEDDDKTFVIEDKPTEHAPMSEGDKEFLEQTLNKAQAKVSVGKFASPRMGVGMVGGPGLISTEVSLTQSEALRIAQNKILELEIEIERLREENESLAAAGEAVTSRADELLAKLERIEAQKLDDDDKRHEERTTLLNALSLKDKELESLKRKEDEFEVRLSSNIKKIRVRERELENRLELVKLEGAALLRNKDEIILDMKRQLDQALHEIGSYRSKGQDLGQQLTDNQDTLRRTVKALRIALSMLEGDINAAPSKKGKAS